MSDTEEQRLARMLADEQYALSEWYTRFNRPAEEGLIPVGPVPDPQRILRLFNAWIETKKEMLRETVCPNWVSLKERHKEAGAAALVLGLTRCLEVCQLGLCDLTATAVILYAKWNIDGFCAGGARDEGHGHP